MTQARANSFDRADGTPKADAPAAAAAGGTSGGGSPPVLSKVAGAVLKELLSSVLGSKAGFTVGRSAMFLIMFLVVHLVGNLALFKGEGAFNEYCYFLNTPPVGLAIKVIEYYLLLAFLAHAGAASLLTLRFNKLKPSAKDPLYVPFTLHCHCFPITTLFLSLTRARAHAHTYTKTHTHTRLSDDLLHCRVARYKYPLGQAKLALTGSVAAVFIVLHVLHFRFSEKNLLHDSSHAQSDTNMHALVLEVVPQYLVLYAAGIIAIGIHLWSGWAKVAKKMGLAKEELQPAIDLGQNGAIAMTVGFLLCLWKANADATAAAK